MKNRCKSRSVWLVWFLLTMNVAASARAARTPDRPLLVSARYCTPVSRPWDKSYYHLYRFNPDGSGKTQLTFGRHDDTAACWSPDGRSVAFASGTDITIQSARPNATPHAILRPRNANFRIEKISWSGDGACLAIEMHDKIVFVTPRGITLRKMKANYKNFLGFAPDGKHYAISTMDGNTYIVETKSGRKTRLAHPGVWWDNKTFLSWNTAENTPDRGATLPLKFTDLQGNVVKQVALRPTALQRKYFKDGRPRFVSVNKVQVTNMKQPNRFKDIIGGIVDVDSADWRR